MIFHICHELSHSFLFFFMIQCDNLLSKNFFDALVTRKEIYNFVRRQKTEVMVFLLVTSLWIAKTQQPAANFLEVEYGVFVSSATFAVAKPVTSRTLLRRGLCFDVRTVVGRFVGAGVGLKVRHVVGCIMVGDIVVGLEEGVVVSCFVVGKTLASSSVL